MRRRRSPRAKYSMTSQACSSLTPRSCSRTTAGLVDALRNLVLLQEAPEGIDRLLRLVAGGRGRP